MYKQVPPCMNIQQNGQHNRTASTCFPLSPSRCIRIFPILIPLQQARSAFSILSPLIYRVHEFSLACHNKYYMTSPTHKVLKLKRIYLPRFMPKNYPRNNHPPCFGSLNYASPLVSEYSVRILRKSELHSFK